MSKHELRIQDQVREWLEENGLYTNTVTFTFEIGGGLLAITVYTEEDWKDLLTLTGYVEDLCDKGGYTLFPDTYTILLSDMALGRIVL